MFSTRAPSPNRRERQPRQPHGLLRPAPSSVDTERTPECFIDRSSPQSPPRDSPVMPPVEPTPRGHQKNWPDGFGTATVKRFQSPVTEPRGHRQLLPRCDGAPQMKPQLLVGI